MVRRSREGDSGDDVRRIDPAYFEPAAYVPPVRVKTAFDGQPLAIIALFLVAGFLAYSAYWGGARKGAVEESVRTVDTFVDTVTPASVVEPESQEEARSAPEPERLKIFIPLNNTMYWSGDEFTVKVMIVSGDDTGLTVEWESNVTMSPAGREAHLGPFTQEDVETMRPYVKATATNAAGEWWWHEALFQVYPPERENPWFSNQ